MHFPSYLLYQPLPTIPLTQLPSMALLNPRQHPKVIYPKQDTRNNHYRPRHNGCHLGCNTPRASLLTININQRRDQSSEGVKASWEEDLIEQPDEILAPSPPQPDHTSRTDTTADAGDHEEIDVLYSVQNLGSRVRGGDFGVCVEGLDGGESSGEDHEAGEEDPGEEGGEDVVQTGDGVEREEHVHVAGLHAVLAVWCSGSSWRGGRALGGCGCVVAMGEGEVRQVDVMF
jgi:hypothetical protein